MMQSPTHVLLVRHGRSTFNDQGRYQGSSDDSVLTHKGRQDAQRVGHYLNQRLAYRPIDLVYTSPLRRVQQTANVIVQSLALAHRPPLIVSSDLKEISLSLWEGLTYAQVKQQFPQQYQCWQQNPAAFELPLPSLLPSPKSDSNSNPKSSQLSTRNSDNSTGMTTAVIAGEQQKNTAGVNTSVVTAPRTYFPVQALYQAAKQFWQTLLSEQAGKTILIVSHSGTIHSLISTALTLSAKHHHSLQQSNCGISELTFRPVDKAHLNRRNISVVNTHNHSQADRDTHTEITARHFWHDYHIQLNQLNQTAALGEQLPKLKVSKTGLRLLLLSEDGLSPERCQRLAVKMRKFPLSFCVASADFQAVSRVLMQPHVEASFIESQSSEFLLAWRRQWVESYRNDQPLMTQKLVTGLVIASTHSIQTLLAQMLAADNLHDSAAPQHIEIAPQHLSIVHYAYSHRPIVQSINTFI